MAKTRPVWHEYFMLLAKIVSTRSTCNSRPVGAVIVRNNEILATGYNGAMPGVDHCIDHNDFEDGSLFCFRRSIKVPDSDKYNFCKSTHAEANAISQAARRGVSIEGATLYITLAPCYPCLKLIASAHLKALYYEQPYVSTASDRDAFWEQETKNAGLEICEQLIISPETYKFCLTDIELPTSRRRMKSTN